MVHNSAVALAARKLDNQNHCKRNETAVFARRAKKEPILGISQIDYSHGRKRSIAAARHDPSTFLDRCERVQCRVSDHLARQQRGDAWRTKGHKFRPKEFQVEAAATSLRTEGRIT